MRAGENIERQSVLCCTNCGNEIFCKKGERCPPCGRCSNNTFIPKPEID